jgi:23S rRNA pseudouridine1911/1915/1917 synthase
MTTSDGEASGEGAPDARISLVADESGVRADKFLAEHSLLSRSALQRLTRDGHVRVDGAIVIDPSHKLRAGQEIVVDIPAAEPDALLRAEDIAVDVIYEDDDVVVVNKPAGLVVHPAHGHKTGTLVNAMLGRIESRTGREAGRPGIVHRLDKDTSGVMIVAKNDVAQLALGRQLQAQRFAKEYLALVWGDPGETDVLIEAPLQRDAEDRRRMVVRASGRDATTRFTRIAAWETATRRTPGAGNSERLALLHVRPVTGRTHQIRVHLAYGQFPIVGDPVYGRRGDDSGLGRQFLHAWRLTVRLPHAGERTFTAPLASDLRAFLGTLGAPVKRTPMLDEVVAAE